MDELALWERCVAFHGHSCGGLAIGFRAALYARELLDLGRSQDEEVVCISENDACGVDAIQVILGCTAGKGNLLFHITGKQAWSFYLRGTDRSVRLVLRDPEEDLNKEQRFDYFRNTPGKDLFDCKKTTLALPEPARIFDSYICQGCGENTAANWIRIQNGRKLCLDCWKPYDRFHI